MRNRNNIIKRITAAMLVILILTSCLGITAYALFYATVEIEENYFKTGKVDIELEFGEDRKDAQLITEDEYLFEPGMTVEKPFYVKNGSTWPVYYRIYFDNVTGGLAGVLEITVLSGTEILYKGTAESMTKENTPAADDLLLIGERRDLTIRFHYPENSGNKTQNWEMKFDLCAEAVQEKNNPDREFD